MTRLGAARIEIQLPENLMVAHLLTRLVTNPRALFCLQLGAAAREAFHSYFAPVFENEALADLEERTDRDADKRSLGGPLGVVTRDVVDSQAASRVAGGRPPRAEWARRVL